MIRQPIRQHLIQLTQADRAEELWDVHCAKMATFGFEKILYGFSYFTSKTSLGDPEDFFLLTNHSRDYIDWYIGEGLYRDAPMVRWSQANEGVCSWGEIYREDRLKDLTQRERDIIQRNAEFGVKAGYTISFKAINTRSKGAIALTASPQTTQDEVDAIWAEHGEDLLLMNTVAHLKLITLPSEKVGRALTKRQREALEWIGDGKTVQDTAILMGLTGATVEKHLRLARDKLNVETTAQAVLKAAFQNQMYVINPS